MSKAELGAAVGVAAGLDESQKQRITSLESKVKYFTSIPTTNVGISIFVEEQGQMHWDSATSSYKKDDILSLSASSGCFLKWDYTNNRYNIRQFGYVQKPTTASPLSITFPIAFPNAVLVDISLSISGALNPNGTAVSIGSLTLSSVQAYTTTGGAGVGIIYSVSGY